MRIFGLCALLACAVVVLSLPAMAVGEMENGNFEAFTGTAAALSAAYPPVGAVLALSADLARTTAAITEQTASEEIAARSTYKQMLGTSQEILQRSVDTFGLGAVANEVARANDRRFFAFALPEEQNFAGTTRRYGGDDRARLKSVVDDSLDDFVAGPRGRDLTLLLLPSLCFGNPLVDPSKWFQQLRKRGGTVMTPEFERWEAGDTMSVHDWRPRSGLFGFRGCRSAENIPLGWGAAEAAVDAQQLEGRLLGDPGGVSENALATALAEETMQARNSAGFAAYSGIAEVRELDYASLANPRFPVNSVAVLARVDADDVRTANVLNVGVGRLRLSENYAGNRLWSLAAAELYFRRPADDSGLIEYASLYNPYWQVRLVEPSAGQRAAALAYVR